MKTINKSTHRQVLKLSQIGIKLRLASVDPRLMQTLRKIDQSKIVNTETLNFEFTI
jgi:anti-anti-sigma regulatory factor